MSEIVPATALNAPVATPAAPAAPAAVVPPVAAPALPMVVTPAVEPPKPVDLAVEVIQYDSTGDPGLDVALEFAGRLGLSPEHPTMAAAAEGNFALLEAHFAALGDKAKGYEKMVALAKASHERGAKDATEKAAAAKAAGDKTEQAIYAVVSGQENWKAIKEWAQKTASEAEQKDIADAFTKGGAVAIGMANYLKLTYIKAGNTFSGKAAVKADAGGAIPAPTKTLNTAEYGMALMKARAEYRGRDFDNSPEYAAVKALRAKR